MFGRRYCFQHLGFRDATSSKLIDFVLERFARRFGKISNSEARKMQARLSKKYTNGNLNTIRQLKSDYACGFSYPKLIAEELSMEILARVHNRIDFDRSLESEYRLPTGKYCKLPKRGECAFCGNNWYYFVKNQDGSEVTKFTGTYLNGVPVCKSKKCRAIAAFYKKTQWAELKLVTAILDVVKNHEHKQRLEKHFI